MSKLRIGLVSIPVEENALSHNLGTVRGVLEERANDEIDLFVFGEAALTGMEVEKTSPGDRVDLSEVLHQVNRLTKDYSTTVCMGFVERDTDRVYLAHCLSSNGALCGLQRKIFAGNPTRPRVFASGTEIRPIPFRGFQAVVLACADWMLPETVMAAGQHEPDLILAPTDQYSWTPHNVSVLHKAGQSASFWLQSPIFAAFNSAAQPADADADVFACLAFDSNGDKLTKAAKKVGETAVHTIDVNIRQAQRSWGGFRDRKRYIEGTRR